jgi:hypothetical protein
VFSMMMEYESTYAASASLTASGLAAKNFSAKTSRNREIFCASPGFGKEKKGQSRVYGCTVCANRALVMYVAVASTGKGYP